MTTPCACPACRRRFFVVNRAGGPASPALCVCGAELVSADLHDGVYEVRRSRRATRRKPGRQTPPRQPAPMPVEPDQGYGESHGYGPAHGGPTGPADAPAPETTTPEEPR